MKHFFLFFLSLTTLVLAVNAQETKPAIDFKFYGYVRYEGYYDTRSSIASRLDNVYLFPKAESLDISGNDLNAKGKLTMFGYQTRLGVKVNGPEILGAKTSANIEGDFMGIGESTTGHIRLRQAWMKMDWENSSLLLGQYWHPIFVPQIYPTVEATGAAVPFYPLNRSPQIRFTYNITKSLTFSAAILGHTEYTSVGVNANPQAEAGIPEFTGQFFYNKGIVTLSATVAHRTVQPNKNTTNDSSLDKTISSVNYSCGAKINAKDFIAKAGLLYGGNLSSLKMIGGYAVSDVNNNYTNINTLSTWVEVEKYVGNFHFGLFGGYAKNTGSEDPIMGSIYHYAGSEGKYIDYTYRISPRVCYTIKNIKFSFEPMYTVASWGDLKPGYTKVLNGKEVSNTRLLIAAQYNF